MFFLDLLHNIDSIFLNTITLLSYIHLNMVASVIVVDLSKLFLVNASYLYLDKTKGHADCNVKIKNKELVAIEELFQELLMLHFHLRNLNSIHQF